MEYSHPMTVKALTLKYGTNYMGICLHYLDKLENMPSPLTDEEVNFFENVVQFPYLSSVAVIRACRRIVAAVESTCEELKLNDSGV